MQIHEIFDAFNKIGSLTFTTMNGDYPSSRIIQLLTYDHNGLYFFTMSSKPFYKQLKETGKVALCGLCAPSEINWKDADTPYSAPGYFIRASGDVREFTIEEAIQSKDPRFDYLISDNKRYPMITGFCLYNFNGEIYDYDFEKEHRGHKLERVRFSFGSMEKESVGLTIQQDQCISCGMCKEACTFSAIDERDGQYTINGNRCDECGNCYSACLQNAIIHKGT